MTARGEPLTILVSGRVAAAAGQGGAAWAVLQYVLGFQRLGHEVYFVEPLEPPGSAASDRSGPGGERVRWFRSVVKRFGLEDRTALILGGGHETIGLPYERLSRLAGRTDVLVNLSGLFREPEIVEKIPFRIYVDLDPGFTQLWQDREGIDMGFEGHTHFATVGLALGDPDCPVPTCGERWLPTLPPVVLDHWAPAGAPGEGAFTTVANWRSYGSIRCGETLYGQKAHSLRRFDDLPVRAGGRFELALAIDPAERRDLDRLAEGGWRLVDPVEAAGTPGLYERFIAGSCAELGIAKSGYVNARCGWFSDRSACYLARGRPVLAQETGYSRYVPTGAGLLAFESMEEAVAGIASIRADWRAHARAARGLAEDVFDSDVVLGHLLRRAGAIA